MLSIAIYSNNKSIITRLKSIIQDFLIEIKAMSKVSVFSDPEKFITAHKSYDIYIMDMESKDDTIELGKKIMEMDGGSYFIYLGKDMNDIRKALKLHINYYLLKPIETEDLLHILKTIKRKIQDDTIVIQIPTGDRKVRANNLNYINIVKRCLCYHLKDGTMFDGQTLRSSFEKAISPLQFHKSKSFLFLPPSLLINIGEVKIVNGDHVIFENDDILYFPKKAHDTVREAWTNYSRFINKEEE